MDSGRAKQLIITSIVISGALASLPDVAQAKWPDMKIAIGGGFAAIVLLALADVEPSIAGAFALTLLVTVTFTKGAPAYAAIEKALGKQPKP